MNLYIDGKLVTIDKVQGKGQINYPPMPSWVAVYVNGYASCHNIPSEWFNTKDKRICKTSGSTYQWK